MRSFVLAALLVVGASCGIGAETTVEQSEGVESLDDAANSLATDSADRSCQVVLRQMTRAATTNCPSSGSCWFVWNGTIDLALSAKVSGSSVWVQYRNQDTATWSKKQARAVTGGPAGFQRYEVTLDTKTFSPGMSATALQRAKLLVLPYLKLRDGSRVFDHNRVPGDFDSYELVSSAQWSVSDDASVCRPAGSSKGVLSFSNGQWPAQHGPLLAGGEGVINYDLNRLTTCRGTHNGFPAFDVVAFARFQPQGTTVQQSVRAFDAPQGTPVFSSLHAVPFTFTVPNGTQSVEVWFQNTGINCEGWDSNNGNNYSFAVSASAPATVGWFGDGAASTSRSCTADRAIPDTLVIDNYTLERSCVFFEMDVWAQGITDAAVQRPELIAARVETTLDGAALEPRWAEFVRRNGNNYRYRFTMPRDVLYYGSKWSTFTWKFAFSTNGVTYSADQARTISRDPSWCNPAWGSCN